MKITSMTTTSRRFSFALAVTLSWAILGVVFPAAADQCKDISGYDCTPYELEEVPLKKVPALFKFQSRISQAKLPVGDVTFNKIFVNVKSGNQSLCTEPFSEVKVRDSVLNLLIGAKMSCDLETVIAKNNDLTFQVCIGNQENCLKPVLLSTVPFAIKSNYATLALKADKANEAVQCHYAHRITADRDLFTSNRIGTGFYDFHTPAPDYIDRLIDLYDDTGTSVQDPDYYYGGYIQWMQVDPQDSNLHICARMADASNGDLARLKQLVMHADVTKTLGQLVVEGDPRWGEPSINNSDSLPKAAVIKRGLDVYKDADFYDKVTMGTSDKLNQSVCEINHSLNVNGISTFDGNSTFNKPATFNGDVTVSDSAVTTINGESNLRGESNFYSDATFHFPLVAKNNTTFEWDAHFAKETQFDGVVTIGTEATKGKILSTVFHDVIFEGYATFKGGASGLETTEVTDIGKNAVDSETIKDNSVMGAWDPSNSQSIAGDIAMETITGTNIASNAISNSEMADDAVGYSEMANDAIGNAEMRDNAIGNGEMRDNAIGNLEMADNAIGNAEMANDAIGWEEMRDNAIGNGEMRDNAIGNPEMADNAIGNAEMANDAIGWAEMRNDAIGRNEMRNNAVGTDELADYSVTNAKSNFAVQEITKDVPANDSIFVRIGDYGICTTGRSAGFVIADCEIYHASTNTHPWDPYRTIAKGWYIHGRNDSAVVTQCKAYCIGLR